MPNLFLPIYNSLEKEVIKLSENIYFDDKQLDVYSIKIAELLIRTVIEIETLSKELYFKNGGQTKYKEDGTVDFLYFDTDCLNYLENLWGLSKKEVIISSANFYFTDKENIILNPLKKANKRGSSSSDWAKAYQCIKHDRSKNLNKATIKNLIRALAALYLLNIYNRTAEEINNITQNNDMSFGSNIFSVKKQFASFLMVEGNVDKIDETVVCIEKFDNEKFKNIIEESRKDLSIQINQLYNSEEYKSFIKDNPEYKIDGKNIMSVCIEIGGYNFMRKIIHSSINGIKLCKPPYIKVLNKNQQIYPEI